LRIAVASNFARMSTTFNWAGRGWIVGGLLAASAATIIALPVANADPACNQTVGQSIDSYLRRHPDVKQHLSSQSQAEGGGPNVLDYLNRHPDVRQHLIDLSQECTD
jgi:hypothetical protein